MNGKSRTLFVTQRGCQQQQWALEGAPPELDVVMRRDPSKEEILELLPEMEFFISERTGVIDADMIAAGKKLRLIQRLGIQAWDIDLEAADQAGIPVCCLPVETCQLVAEHVFLQMLGLVKRVRELMKISEDGEDWGIPPQRCHEDCFAYNWSRRENVGGIMDKKVGILGFGEIGLELATRLRSFGSTVVYNKRHQLPPIAEQQFSLHYASKEELAATCDVVIALLPQLPGSEESLNADFFRCMKPGALFIQSGGSGTVDENALADAIRSRYLGGAAVDGFTWEPVQPDNPLLSLARDPMVNLILTPHVAAGAVRHAGPMRAGDYVNVSAALHGGKLIHRLV
jgi:phosphoglycerate dehydrogenase-like enzyme